MYTFLQLCMYTFLQLCMHTSSLIVVKEEKTLKEFSLSVLLHFHGSGPGHQGSICPVSPNITIPTPAYSWDV